MRTVVLWNNPASHVVNGVRKTLPEYSQWQNMKDRSEDSFVRSKANYAYRHCRRTEEWDSFDIYMEWAKSQVGFLSRDNSGKLFVLDKDILFKANQLYCPDTCVFIPQRLNSFFAVNKKPRDNASLGTYKSKVTGRYEAQIDRKSYTTEYEAFIAYKLAKEAIAKELALQYEGVVDNRVLEALRQYELTEKG